MNQPATSANPIQIGDIIDGKYRVEAVLGEGGMGVVLAARHLTLESEVAIKVLLPKLQSDPIVRERFLREARSAAQLRSRHVTQVLDIGIDRVDAPYIVMERLRGKDLEQLIAETGPLDETVAIQYVVQACEALAEAHAAGIVHRDLKPENLFVTAQCVKVLDFGISKSTNDPRQLTGTSDVMGTPHFMSPEQFKSTRDVSARTDVWALGAILYRALTGALPFDGQSFVDLCARIMTQAPTPIEVHRPNVSAGMAAIVRRCLEKDPSLRFANAHELREALKNLLAQKKADARLAMAATLPIPQVPAHLLPLPPMTSPWPSSAPSAAPKKSRLRAPLVAMSGLVLAGLLAYGGTHRSHVMHYVHPAPMTTETPAASTAEPLEARGSLHVVETASVEPPVKVAARRSRSKRGAL